MSDEEDRGPDLAGGIAIGSVGDRTLVRGTFDGEDVVVVRDGGRWCAWSGKCTHLGAPLADGLLVDGQLRCPWHHARFSIATGEAIAAPAFEPLVRFDVEARDDRLFVTGKAGTAARRANDTSGDASAGRVVILGGGAGGYACAEMLVRLGHAGTITMISDDSDPPYDRTQCSKQYLIGQVSRDDCDLAGRLLDKDGGPVVWINREATAIDVDAREVQVDGGEAFRFDTLVLATGAEPQRPDVPGFDGPNVHVLRTMADANALIDASKDGKRAVVIGASFIGLEAAASLTQRDVEVHVVATDDVPLEKILGAEVGAMIRDVHEERGVRLHLGRKPTRFDGRVLTLDDGSTIDADFVVLGTGVKPRTTLAEAAGLEVARPEEGGGVVVDVRLQTSVAGIHAIGDIARYPDAHAKARIRVEHWVHAERQGQFVARLLMKQADRFDDLPFFWSAHFDTGLVYVGHVDAIDRAEVDGSIAGRAFTIRYIGKAGDQAFVACDRELRALEVEARIEAEPER